MRTAYLRYWLYGLSWLLMPCLPAQNLIPNPSFDQVNLDDCADSLNHHVYLVPPWYAAAEEPDLYAGGCGPQYPPRFPEERPDGLGGSNFVGLWASTYGNGLANGDAIGVPLLEPLEDRLYYFRAWINNRGSYNSLNPGSYCPTIPARELGVYLSPDAIQVIRVTGVNPNNILDNYLSGRRVWADSSYQIRSTEAIDDGFWIEGCLPGQAGDAHLAIAPLYGLVGFEPSCADASGFFDFQTYYYEVDNLSLEALPASFQFTAEICEQQGTVVNVRDRITDVRLAEGEVRWPNGLIADEQRVMEVGTLELQLVLPGGEIPIELAVSAVSCETQVFSANAFTPNGDGINDVFLPSLNTIGQISQYEFQVFDQWGRVVFQSQNPATGWDGRGAGRYAQEGLYAWRLQVIFGGELNVRTVRRQGTVTLLR